MSLFKTKEWWRTECGTNGTFDKQSLLVAPLLGPDKKDVIIVGNNGGFLRIYNPLARWMEATFPIPYTSQDLIIEIQLSDSIVDLKAGKFLSGSQKCCLAVLMPEKLIVYHVQLTEGSVGLGDKCSLEVEYERQLPSLSMSMTVGPFGRAHGRDFLCIQFVNGTLLFFEQELHSFVQDLKNRLKHEPLVYLEANDVFVTQNADWILSLYRYQNIAEFRKSVNNDSESTRTVEPDSKYNLGEAVLAIESVTVSSIETGIIVMSEKNLYIFHDTHLTLKFTKRLEYNVVCVQTYIIEPDGKLLCIIVTDTKTLLVYEGSSLKWSAEVPFVPVAVTITHSQDVKGLIVILSEDGHLEVCFLGSQPSLYIAPSIYRRRYNYVDAENELATLRPAIRKCVHYGEDIITDVFPDIEVQLTPEIDQNNAASEGKFSKKTIQNGERDTVFVHAVKLETSTFLNDIQVYVEISEPWRVSQDNCTLPHLYGQHSFPILIDLERGIPILSSELEIIVAYENDQGDIHIVKKRFPLDMRILFTTCPPESRSLYKMTIESDDVATGQIFRQSFDGWIAVFPQDHISNSVSVKLTHQDYVVSMTFESPILKIHVHSNNELGMFLVINYVMGKMADEVTKKLHVCIGHERIHSVMDFMKAYSDARHKIRSIKNEITLLTSQLRNIIRKMMHIRERNFQLSADIGLLTFLRMTCQAILSLLESFMELQRHRIRAAHHFHCVLQLILKSLKINVKGGNMWSNLESAVGFELQSEDDVAWEDVTRSALRTILGNDLQRFHDEPRILTAEKIDLTQDVLKMGEYFSYIIDRATIYNLKFT